MASIVAYLIRDLHATSPDDEQPGVHDVVAKTDEGRYHYSEDVFDSLVQARTFVEERFAEPWPIDHWDFNEVKSEDLGEIVETYDVEKK